MKLVVRSDSESPRPELRTYFRVDWAFHEAIIQATGNRFIVDMSARIRTHAQRLRQFVAYRHIDVDEAVAEHAAILAAFEAQDPAGVVAAMRRHIESVRHRARADLNDRLWFVPDRRALSGQCASVPRGRADSRTADDQDIGC